MKLQVQIFSLLYLIEYGVSKSESQPKLWLDKDFQGQQNLAKMHAFIVRDEDVPDCGVPAKDVSNIRYFMCSGIVVSRIHVLTTASCIHYAYVYKHYLEADTAVMIGLSSSSYHVIKIEKYEMHPKYNNDIDSTDYATHNLAFIILACPIPTESLVIPKLPTSLYDDVAHKCCLDRCQLLTVVQYPNNYQKAKIITAKYLPAPVHEELEPDFHRKIREVTQHDKSTTKTIKTNETDSVKKKKEEVNAILSLLGSPKSNRRSKNGTSSKVKTEAAKPIDDSDWQFLRNASTDDKIKETNLEAVDDLIKKLTDSIVQRMKSVIDGVAGQKVSTNGTSDQKEISSRLFGENKSLDYIADVFSKTILKTALMNLNRSSSNDPIRVESLDISGAKNGKCPPLGTPVLSDDVLVGMIAYTCDDAQSWVEWKYVNIAKNVNWIRKKLDQVDSSGQSNVSETSFTTMAP